MLQPINRQLFFGMILFPQPQSEYTPRNKAILMFKAELIYLFPPQNSKKSKYFFYQQPLALNLDIIS